MKRNDKSRVVAENNSKLEFVVATERMTEPTDTAGTSETNEKPKQRGKGPRVMTVTVAGTVLPSRKRKLPTITVNNMDNIKRHKLRISAQSTNDIQKKKKIVFEKNGPLYSPCYRLYLSSKKKSIMKSSKDMINITNCLRRNNPMKMTLYPKSGFTNEQLFEQNYLKIPNSNSHGYNTCGQVIGALKTVLELERFSYYLYLFGVSENTVDFLRELVSSYLVDPESSKRAIDGRDSRIELDVVNNCWPKMKGDGVRDVFLEQSNWYNYHRRRPLLEPVIPSTDIGITSDTGHIYYNKSNLDNDYLLLSHELQAQTAVQQFRFSSRSNKLEWQLDHQPMVKQMFPIYEPFRNPPEFIRRFFRDHLYLLNDHCYELPTVNSYSHSNSSSSANDAYPSDMTDRKCRPEDMKSHQESYQKHENNLHWKEKAILNMASRKIVLHKEISNEEFVRQIFTSANFKYDNDENVVAEENWMRDKTETMNYDIAREENLDNLASSSTSNSSVIEEATVVLPEANAPLNSINVIESASEDENSGNNISASDDDSDSDSDGNSSIDSSSSSNRSRSSSGSVSNVSSRDGVKSSATNSAEIEQNGITQHKTSRLNSLDANLTSTGSLKAIDEVNRRSACNDSDLLPTIEDLQHQALECALSRHYEALGDSVLELMFDFFEQFSEIIDEMMNATDNQSKMENKFTWEHVLFALQHYGDQLIDQNDTKIQVHPDLPDLRLTPEVIQRTQARLLGLYAGAKCNEVSRKIPRIAKRHPFKIRK